MRILSGFNKDNYSLLNVIYHSTEDVIDIVLKENEGNKKKLITHAEPEYDAYIVKPKYRDYSDYNPIFMELDKCTKESIKYKSLPYRLPRLIDDEEQREILREYNRTKDFSLLKNYNLSPYLFGTDFDIEHAYRLNYRLNYENLKNKRTTKAYLDIEVDVKEFEGVPTQGECPINLITVIDGETNTSYSFVLRNDKIEKIQDIEDNIDEFKALCHEKFHEVYGDITYNIKFFDDELAMIIEVFATLNKINRDFILIWNISFDLPYIIERINVLGGDPAQIMSHPDFPIKEAWFRQDNFAKTIPGKSHKYKISMYSVWLCQMINYAGLRKSGSEVPSYQLNDVGMAEIGDSKIDYSEEINIKLFPYLNFEKFFLYNIKDVLLQKGIEEKTQDVDTVYLRSYLNSTDYTKIFKQTVFLKHRVAEEFFRQGVVPGNNINTILKNLNVTGDDDDIGFAGALVADPLLNNKNGIVVMGEKSQFIFKFVVDYDFSAMYPNIIMSNNISPHTMYGKIIIDRTIQSDYNKFDFDHDTYDAGREFLDNYTSEDVVAFGKKWLNLPTTEDLISIVESELGLENVIDVELIELTKAVL